MALEGRFCANKPHAQICMHAKNYADMAALISSIASSSVMLPSITLSMTPYMYPSIFIALFPSSSVGI